MADRATIMRRAVNLLEVIHRQERHANDGGEVRRRLYVEPFLGKNLVVAALLGGLDNDGNRIPPALDSHYTYMYCSEANVEQLHPDAMMGSPALGDPIMFPDDPGGGVGDTLKTVTEVNARLFGIEIPHGHKQEQTVGLPIEAGAVIEAVYRPLVFTGPQDWGLVADEQTDKWDFVNPRLEPMTKVASAGKLLKVTVTTDDPFTPDNWLPYPSLDAEAFVTQGMSTFTIERRMVARPPYTLISKLKGKVNRAALSFTNGMTFPADTLRFDDADIRQRTIPAVDGTLQTWFDITYSFTFNSIYDEYWQDDPPNGTNGKFVMGYVGWNRVLCTPTGRVLGMATPLPAILKGAPTTRFTGGKIIARTAYYPVGWQSDLFAVLGLRGLYPQDGFVDIGQTGATAKTFKNLFYRGEL